MEIGYISKGRGGLELASARGLLFVPDRRSVTRYGLKAGDWVAVEVEAGRSQGARVTIVFMNVRPLRSHEVTATASLFRVSQDWHRDLRYRFEGLSGDDAIIGVTPVLVAESGGSSELAGVSQNVQLPLAKLEDAWPWRESDPQLVILKKWHGVPLLPDRDEMRVAVAPARRAEWERFCAPFRAAWTEKQRLLAAKEAARLAEVQAAKDRRIAHLLQVPEITGVVPVDFGGKTVVAIFDGQKGKLASYVGQPDLLAVTDDREFAGYLMGRMDTAVRGEVLGTTATGDWALRIAPLSIESVRPGTLVGIGAVKVVTQTTLTGVEADSISLTAKAEVRTDTGSYILAQGSPLPVRLPLDRIERVVHWRTGLDWSPPQQIFLSEAYDCFAAGMIEVQAEKEFESAWITQLARLLMDEGWVARTFFQEHPGLLPEGKKPTWEGMIAAAKAAGLVRTSSSSREIWGGGLSRISDDMEVTVTSYREFIVVCGKEFTIRSRDD